MTTTQEYYDQHLGPVYTWMLGDFDATREAVETELQAVGLAPKKGDLVVDLGCGSGQFAMALAKTGASVLALDTCELLLSELKERAGELDVRPICTDIVSFRQQLDRGAAGIVCMGDTLTHLSSVADVHRLLQNVAAALSVAGVFIATFRDYTGEGPSGDARFILVRSDEHRILTCFIDYEETRVNVTDMIHEQQGESWTLRTSSYQKIKLDPRSVADILTACGLTVRLEAGTRSMTRIVAVREL